MTVCSAIKRLSFGVNVAPENYQYIISQVIADIEGVVNIADDLIVTIQYNTIQYNTIQYNTIQYNTIQYNTIQMLLSTPHGGFSETMIKMIKKILKDYG